jgi:hypothetical protein
MRRQTCVLLLSACLATGLSGSLVLAQEPPAAVRQTSAFAGDWYGNITRGTNTPELQSFSFAYDGAPILYYVDPSNIERQVPLRAVGESLKLAAVGGGIIHVKLLQLERGVQRTEYLLWRESIDAAGRVTDKRLVRHSFVRLGDTLAATLEITSPGTPKQTMRGMLRKTLPPSAPAAAASPSPRPRPLPPAPASTPAVHAQPPKAMPLQQPSAQAFAGTWSGTLRSPSGRTEFATYRFDEQGHPLWIEEGNKKFRRVTAPGNYFKYLTPNRTITEVTVRSLKRSPNHIDYTLFIQRGRLSGRFRDSSTEILSVSFDLSGEQLLVTSASGTENRTAGASRDWNDDLTVSGSNQRRDALSGTLTKQ